MIVDWTMLLTAWTFRPVPLLLAGAAAWLYVRGRQRSVEDSPATNLRQFAFSLVVFVLALVSPINRLAHSFFFMHVAQHLLLISLFPATFMGSDPLPTMAAGLPAGWWAKLRGLYDRWRPAILSLTPKGACWFFFVAVVWVWYDPALHALTLTYPLLYDLAIVTMMIGALLHWWHVTAAAPRLHPRLPGFTHMGYTFLGAAPLKIPGLIFLIAYLPFYSYPTGVFLGFEIDPLLSQQLGGMIVWSLGGVVYSTTAVSFFSRWLGGEAEKPEQPRSVWDNDETFIAPHLE